MFWSGDFTARRRECAQLVHSKCSGNYSRECDCAAAQGRSNQQNNTPPQRNARRRQTQLITIGFRANLGRFRKHENQCRENRDKRRSRSSGLGWQCATLNLTFDSLVLFMLTAIPLAVVICLSRTRMTIGSVRSRASRFTHFHGLAAAITNISASHPKHLRRKDPQRAKRKEDPDDGRFRVQRWLRWGETFRRSIIFGNGGAAPPQRNGDFSRLAATSARARQIFRCEITQEASSRLGRLQTLDAFTPIQSQAQSTLRDTRASPTY